MTTRSAALSAFAAWLLVTGCAAKQSASPEPLVGAWRSSVRFTTGPLTAVEDFQFLYVFNAGGTMTESSNYDAAPPVPPAYGIWRSVGPREFEAKYEFFPTTPSAPDAFNGGAGWLPAGRGVLTERLTLSEDGRSFRSTIRYESYDAQGEPQEGAAAGEGHGVRIEF
jgi:hypothetical protein